MRIVVRWPIFRLPLQGELFPICCFIGVDIQLAAR